MAEYEAVIAGLQAALKLDALYMKVLGDSLLVISQARGEWHINIKESRLMMERCAKAVAR